jgi:hypothetical protein
MKTEVTIYCRNENEVKIHCRNGEGRSTAKLEREMKIYCRNENGSEDML